MSRRFLTDTSNSEDRLARLIADRLAPNADKEKIDQRIWDLFGEEWSVMFTDLSGFSRRVAEFGIIHFLQTIYESERLLLPVIESHDGFVLKSEGDSLLAIFRNPCKALQGAISMQHVLAEYNQTQPDEEKVLLCVGLGHGHMLRVGDTDIFGAEVNAASKLGEDIASAGDILVTGAFKAACGDALTLPCESIMNAPAGTDSAYRVNYA